MAKFKIETPIWGTQSIGLADYKLTKGGFNTVEIRYTDQHGNRVFPHIYGISTIKAKQYPTKIVGRNVVLRVIPIKDMEIVQ